MKQVDFASFPFAQMLEYSYQVDLCYPWGVDDYILMQPFPKEKSQITAPIKPFNSDVKFQCFEKIVFQHFLCSGTHLYSQLNKVWALVIVSIIAFIAILQKMLASRSNYIMLIICKR